MTNDPLDPEEAPLWEQGVEPDQRFHPVLRLDRILNLWADHWQTLESQGYAVDADAVGRSEAEVRRFLSRWYERMRPVYMAVSLRDTFDFPDNGICGRLLAIAVLPGRTNMNCAFAHGNQQSDAVRMLVVSECRPAILRQQFVRIDQNRGRRASRVSPLKALSRGNGCEAAPGPGCSVKTSNPYSAFSNS